jgi:ABC-2 type transport system ATP-binding protein
MTSSKPKVNLAEIVATLRDVTVTYDGYQTRALSHVDLDFRRGEITGVLGAKDAGKSTVFKLLAGQLSPTEGAVKVFGRSARGGAKARVGYLPGKVDPNRPAGFVDRLLGRKKKSPPAGRGVARLAQAMLGNRDLLVLDDPFLDLEPAELTEAKALIRDMASRGKTVVLSSDSLMDVRDICERFVILHEGKVQGAGTLAELLSAPAAIRFLPAVLPNKIVERVLGILREEILDSLHGKLAKASEECEPAPLIRDLADDLNPSSRPAPASGDSTPHDAIDHEKLKALIKPTPK